MSSVRVGYFHAQSVYQRIQEWITHLLEVNKQKNTISVLDGVRAIACLSVITFHVSFYDHIWDMKGLGQIAVVIAMAGDSGVTLFFVLSGFLLFLPYAKNLLFGGEWPAMRQFYLRRAIRILPAYYCSLFLIILIAHPEYLHLDHWKQLLPFLTFFMDSNQTQAIDGPYWTLAVEWQFYLILPFLALAMRPIVQRGSLKRRVWMLAGCLFTVMFWGVCSRYWGLYLTAHPTKTFLVPRSILNIAMFFLYGDQGTSWNGKYLEDFAVGMLAAFCYILARNTAAEGTFNKVMRRLSPWLWGSGLLWLIVMAFWESSMANPQERFLPHVIFNTYVWSHELGYSLGFGICIVAILFGCAGLQSMFAWSPLRWIGLLSYSLYIWHVPILDLFRAYVLPYVQTWQHPAVYGLYWIWVLLVVFPLALASYLLIEKPWMLLGERLRKTR